MDIFEKARELGQMLAASEQNQRVIHAEIAQTNDEEAQKLLMHYNEKRKEIARKMKEGQSGPEEMEAFRNELQNEFNVLLENKNIKEYIEAKKSFDQLVRTVNDILNYYITGEEKSGCSSRSCSGCSGCN